MEFSRIDHDFGISQGFEDFRPNNYQSEDPHFCFDFDQSSGLYRGWVTLGWTKAFNHFGLEGFLETPEDLKGDKVLILRNRPLIRDAFINNRVYEVWFSPPKAIPIPSEPTGDYSGILYFHKPVVGLEDTWIIQPAQIELAKRMGANAIYEKGGNGNMAVGLIHPFQHVKAVYWRDFIPDNVYKRLFHGL